MAERVLNEPSVRPDERGQAVSLLEAVLADSGVLGTSADIDDSEGAPSDDGQPEEGLRVAQVLAPVYADAENWNALYRVLLVQIDSEATLDSERVDLRVRLAEVQEDRLRDPVGAFATWRVLLEDPDAPDTVLGECERLADALGDFDAWSQILQSQAASHSDAELGEKANLLSRAATIEAERAERPAAATALWEKVLALDPGNQELAGPAVDALEHLYVQAANDEALVKVLLIRADWHEPGETRTALLMRVADIQANAVEDLPAAIRTLETLLEEQPDDQTALAVISGLYARTDRRKDQVSTLERQAVLAEAPEDKKTLRLALADVSRTHLNDLDAAIEAVRTLLDEVPDDVDAFIRLEALYAEKGAAQEQFELLERRLALTTEGQVQGGTQRDLLARMGVLMFEKLEQPEQAFEHWNSVLVENPDDQEIQDHIERLLDGDASLSLRAAEALEPVYQKDKRWADLARLVEIYVRAEDDPEPRAVHWLRLADLRQKRLRDEAGAIDALDSAIRDAVRDPELETHLDTFEGWLPAGVEGRQLQLYRDIEPEVGADDTKLRLCRTIGRLALETADADTAVDYYGRVLDLVPGDKGALSTLQKIHSESGDDAALLQVLQMRAEHSPGNDEIRTENYVEVGHLAARLGRVDEAIDAYEKALEVAPGEKAALDALEELYVQADRYDALTALLEKRAGYTRDGDAQAQFYFRMAEIDIDQHQALESALVSLERALTSNPVHAPTVGRLRNLLDDPEVRGRAAELLEPVFVRMSSWRELAETVQLRMTHTEDLEEKAQLARRVARIYEEQIEDLDGAFECWSALFEEMPTDPRAREQLLRLAAKIKTVGRGWRNGWMLSWGTPWKRARR